EMVRYAGGPPTLAGGAAASALLARTGEDDASDARVHDLARRPSDDRLLAVGRAVGGGRPLFAGLQAVGLAPPPPPPPPGRAGVVLACGRRAVLLLAVPFYYLATESFFLYEWRVAVPMHYALFACAAAPAVVAGSAVRSALARLRGQNHAG